MLKDEINKKLKITKKKTSINAANSSDHWFGS
jgi:hypothetical protein